MAKVIIEKGNAFKKKCNICGCIFQYTIEDCEALRNLRTTEKRYVVSCPECNTYIDHKSGNSIL